MTSVTASEKIAELKFAVDTTMKQWATIGSNENRRKLASVLTDFGTALHNFGVQKQAVDAFEQGLRHMQALYEADPSPALRLELASSLNNLGVAYGAIGDHRQAISVLEETREHMQALYEADPSPALRLNLASTLNNLGNTYGAIGQHRQAISVLEETLDHNHTLYEADPSPVLRFSLAQTLNNLGVAYCSISEHRPAISVLEEARGHNHALYEADPSPALRFALAQNLNNLGNAYGTIGDHWQAISILKETSGHDQALFEADPSPALGLSIAATLNSLVVSYYAISDFQLRFKTAFSTFTLAGVFNGSGDQFTEISCRASHGLSLAHLSVGGHDSTSIVLSKLAVNELLKLRELNRGLGEDQLGQMMGGYEHIPQFLVQLLVQEGRFGEAGLVARLAKIAEAQALGQRFNAGHDEQQIGYTELEQQALDIIKSGVKKEDVVAELDKILDGNGDIEEPDLSKGWLGEVSDLFRREEEAHKAELDRRNASLLQDLRASHVLPVQERLALGVAVLMYTVADDELIIIATTADHQDVFREPIKRDDLSAQVFAFQASITTRDSFAEAAKALCDLMIPVGLNQLLVQDGIGLLMISALDVVRQVPFASLYDGTSYLIERFAISFVNEAGRVDMTRPLSMDWDRRGIAGFAVTKAHGSYGALTHAGEEIDAIIRPVTKDKGGGEAGPRSPETPGLYPGTRDKDEAFTHDSLIQRLAHEPPVIHFATHFTFNDVHEASSCLLMGDGSELTLFDMADMRFPGCDMVVLSACETGRTSGRREKPGAAFDGMSGFIQSRGAKSVMASLWPVADQSTAKLMQRFYHHCKSGLPPVLALQAAQLEFIGRSKPTGTSRSSPQPNKRGISSTPPRHTSTATPYSHPFNWAPFIITGNPG